MIGQNRFFSINKTLLIGVSALTLMSLDAHAQIENATKIADPSRAAQTLRDTGITRVQEYGDYVTTEDYVQNAPDGAENITLQLNNVQIDGVSAYTADQLDPVYRDKLGTTVTLAEVYDIMNTLTRKYRNDGYILTQAYIPPQTIEEGTVKFRVVEGFVDQINIQGDLTEQEEKIIRGYAEGMKRTGIFDAATMEHYLFLINDLPGVTARAVLGKSRSVTGAADLTLAIERDAYDAEIGLDNHGSRYLGPYQSNYGGNLNSVFGLNERIFTQFAMAGDKERANELFYGSIGIDLPLSVHGTKLSLLGQRTNTRPGHDLRDFKVKGNSTFARATISHPFIRSRTTNLFARASFDVRDVDSKNNLQPNTTKDRIRSVRLGSTLQFMDTFIGLGLNSFDIEFSQGVEIFGTTQKDSAIKTRASGDPQYKKIEFSGQRLQRVNESVNLLFAGAAQWSSAPLLSSEEFGVGGMNFGRGYDSSEIVGDDGIAGKIEIQWNEPKKLRYIHDYQLFAHFDIGRVWNQQATTSAGKRDSIASAGLGVRADITEKIEAGVGVSLPLTRERDITNDRDPRYYFNISHKF